MPFINQRRRQMKVLLPLTCTDPQYLYPKQTSQRSVRRSRPEHKRNLEDYGGRKPSLPTEYVLLYSSVPL